MQNQSEQIRIEGKPLTAFAHWNISVKINDKYIVIIYGRTEARDDMLCACVYISGSKDYLIMTVIRHFYCD